MEVGKCTGSVEQPRGVGPMCCAWLWCGHACLTPCRGSSRSLPGPAAAPSPSPSSRCRARCTSSVQAWLGRATSQGLVDEPGISFGHAVFLGEAHTPAAPSAQRRPGQRCQQPSDPTRASTLGPWHWWGNTAVAEGWGAGSSSQGCAMVLGPWGHGGQGKGQGMGRIWVLSCWFSSQDGQRVLERARRVQPCLWFGVC